MEQGQASPEGQTPPEQAPGQPQQPAPEQKKSKSNVVVIIIAIVVVFGLIAIAGGYFALRAVKNKVSQKIGQSMGENMMEKAIEAGTGQKADVSADGKSVSVKTEEGGTFAVSDEGTISLPADFPADVFVPSGAKITLASSTPANPANETKASFLIGFTVSQSVNDMAAKYKDEMAKNGWTMETEANYGAMMINFVKGNRSALVTISSDQSEAGGGVTGISIAGSEN